MSAPTTRFAPAPTGLLHLGHVVNAIWVWGAARALGGRVLQGTHQIPVYRESGDAAAAVDAAVQAVNKGEAVFRIEPDEKIEVESPETVAARRREITTRLLA